MDPRVLDIPTWRRRLVVNLFILPFRPKQSGAAYAKIWTDRGSPLMVHSEALTDKVQRRLGDDVEVVLAMRYGRPSIRSALERFREAGIEIPFPQRDVHLREPQPQDDLEKRPSQR